VITIVAGQVPISPAGLPDMTRFRNSLKRLVDVTGIEPVTPCLQSIGLDSIRSIHYFQLLTFQQIGETAFRSKLSPMA
jgi:hypothetical protein